MKKFSEFLDGEINFIIHDFKGYSYDFPNQPNTAKINNLYLYDGTWEGTTNQGYDISFVVINNIVETLSIKMRIVGSLCNVQWTTEGSRDITIVNNSYSWHVEITDVFIENFTGTFASNLKCDGTWNFTDFDCNGYASGSWKATNLTPATTTTTTTTTTTSTTTNPTSTTTTTLPISPQVITGSSKVITSNTTILNGKVNPNGSNTEAYFEYGSTTNYEYSTETQLLGSGSALLTVSATIPDLVAETLYHYRLVASNSAGNSQGADETFYTFISYVSPDAMCGGNIPCYATVQSAVDASETEGVIKILQGAFDENIVTNQSYNLTLSGGWDSTFTTQASDTLINSLTIKGSAETVEIDNITIQ